MIEIYNNNNKIKILSNMMMMMVLLRRRGQTPCFILLFRLINSFTLYTPRFLSFSLSYRFIFMFCCFHLVTVFIIVIYLYCWMSNLEVDAPNMTALSPPAPFFLTLTSIRLLLNAWLNDFCLFLHQQ